MDFITAVRAPEIKSLVGTGAIQLSLFDETDIFEIIHPDYPGQRLVACKNPALAESRATKREALLAATEADLNKIAAAVKREKRPLSGKDKIALRVGRVINAHKVAKHFVTDITDDSFSYHRDQDKVRAEAALDGVYVVRTNLEEQTLGTSGVVGSYKALSDVSWVFRGFNTDFQHPPDPPPERGQGAHACVLADAVLLRELAHAAPSCPDAVPRRRPRSGRGRTLEPRGSRSALACCDQQGPHELDRRGLPGPLLQDHARRLGHDLSQQDQANRCQPTIFHNGHQRDPTPAPGPGAARRIGAPWCRVVMTPGLEHANQQVDGLVLAQAGGTSA
ncbi:MAG: hypothetical protein ACYDH5_20495 [Acidimicrobiales bacterium]